MPDSLPSLLSLNGVSREYGSGARRFLALQGIDLEIQRGEFVCLVGPSGCGKSTLLRIITGLDRPTTGAILYHGEPLRGVNPNATIVFQTFALFPWLTVQENVEVALKARGMPASERGPRALRLIDMVGLDGFEGAYPRELSGGMRQKVGFARAMAVEPELLCLDEPFSALDVLAAEALRGELLELWLNHTIPTQAVLMVTHNIEEAVLLAERIVVMDKEPGRITAEVHVNLRHPRQRKDTAFQAILDRVYGAVATKGAPLVTVASLAGPASRLPPARINALAGLCERLAEEGGQADLFRVARELQLQLDGILPLVDGASLLGFAHVAEGDLVLSPLGRTVADATILARKEMVAGRILRLPMIQWIYETLQKDDNHRVAEDYFLDRLRDDFGEEAPGQLETAINWGRYAELFAFDDASGELFLEG